MPKKPAKPAKSLKSARPLRASKAAPAPLEPVLDGMPRKEAAPFALLLKAKQKVLSGDISHMEEESLQRGKQENASRDISSFADHGTDNFEQEFTIGLIENEEDALREIEAALDRIQEGTFGACETCGKRVSKERLKIVPFTRHCIECQRKEEGRG